MRFFQKIGKFALFSIELTPNLTIWVENSEKLDFSVNKYEYSDIVSTNNYMWVHISAIAKTIVFPQKIEVEILHKLYPTKASTIIVENTENLLYSSSYTIEYKIVRTSHLLSHKIGIFSSATAIVLQTSINCSHTKLSKQQLTAHMSIVKGNMTKCYKHTPFSSSTLLSALVLKSQLALPQKIQNK